MAAATALAITMFKALSGVPDVKAPQVDNMQWYAFGRLTTVSAVVDVAPVI